MKLRRSVEQQVKTTVERHGKEFYKEIGSMGGNASPTKYDRERGKAAANARWEKYRQEQKLKKERKEQLDGQTE